MPSKTGNTPKKSPIAKRVVNTNLKTATADQIVQATNRAAEKARTADAARRWPTMEEINKELKNLKCANISVQVCKSNWCPIQDAREYLKISTDRKAVATYEIKSHGNDQHTAENYDHHDAAEIGENHDHNNAAEEYDEGYSNLTRICEDWVQQFYSLSL